MDEDRLIFIVEAIELQVIIEADDGPQARAHAEYLFDKSNGPFRVTLATPEDIRKIKSFGIPIHKA